MTTPEAASTNTGRPLRPGARPRMCSETVTSTRGISDRKSTRLNSSHGSISYAVFCLKKKKRRRLGAVGAQPLMRTPQPLTRRVRGVVPFALHRGVFFFDDTATTEIYTLSLHDALPICTSTRGI